MPTASKPAYWRCSLRLSRFTVAYCGQLAIRDGWEVADLARTLICIGAVVSFLSLKKGETVERFKKRAMLRRTLGALDSVLGHPIRRPYAYAGIGQSELLTVRLPPGLSRTIRDYVNASSMSMNHVLGVFLQHGLIIYMKGENSLLDTIRSLAQELAEFEKRESRKDSSIKPGAD